MSTAVGLAAVFTALAIMAAPASAGVSHAYSSSFGSAASTPTNPYPLSGPTEVSVYQQTEDVYVTDLGNHRIEKFDKTGHLVLMFGKGVNSTTGGDVCTIASGNTCQAGTPGGSPGQLGTPAYVAVDNSGGPSDGDVYVGDTADNVVSKFDSSGALITTWGNHGQKTGTDITGNVSHTFAPIHGVAVAKTNGHLYVLGMSIYEYTQDGSYIKWYVGGLSGFQNAEYLETDPERTSYLFVASGTQLFLAFPEFACGPPEECQGLNEYEYGTGTPITGFALDPALPELYQDTGTLVYHYSDCEPVVNGPCDPADSFGSGHLAGGNGVAVDGATHTVYVADTTAGEVAVFGDVRPIVTTGPPSNVSDSSVTMTGHIDPAGRGEVNSCRFEYGFTKAYDHALPCTPDPSSSGFNGPTEVTATISGLSPGTTDHYRVVAGNVAEAVSVGADETFITTQAPAITGLKASNLTATTADLEAKVNPNGLETKYRFEYGTTIEYGQSAPIPDGVLTPSNSDQSVLVHLEGLIPHNAYHYRIVATNNDGTTTVEDHIFNFYPPNCPNSNVRQQTQANYLPDCRAYELVSPEDAGGTQLYAEGPNTGYATSPSRFSFSGAFSTVPGSGGEPIDGSGDLYVATRTATRWTTRYVGIPAKEAAITGGPPLGPPNSTPAPEFRSPSVMATNTSSCLAHCQNYVYTDPGMNLFADFNGGNQSIQSIFTSDFQNKTVIASNSPYVWKADGSFVDRWPTNLATVPPGVYPAGSKIYPAGGHPTSESELSVSPAGKRSLDCPWIGVGQDVAADNCPGDVTTSGDMSHFVFATEWNAFAPGGKLGAPGSVYDNDTGRATITVASKLSTGEDIPSEPGDLSGDPLQIPDVSQDGSHILMAAGGTGPCGTATCPVPPCGDDYSQVRRCQMQPSHLYMRVDGMVTYDVSQGHDVRYIGATGDGTKVFFTSEEALTPDDLDTSVDLYMWSEAGALAGNPIVLVSGATPGGGAGEPGNSDGCVADFTEKCDVTTYTQQFYCENEKGPAVSGNCISDNAIAGDSGDIYFFSPEQLDGTRGIPNQENLYVYRNGRAQYVTSLIGDQYCYGAYSFSKHCQRIERMQVSPDDSYMAFITNTKVTQYDNSGHMEMYRYTPSSRALVCASCRPDGEPPISEVTASQDGLFMTNDGRTFFSTEDPLVHGDTNESIDVYEYVDGRPQLITPGTGETRVPPTILFRAISPPGLVGVSADGRDVYFAIYDTLVPQDHNGLFAKFYDARSGGGFPASAPVPPCEAADECHGESSSAPAAIADETSANLVVGNVPAGKSRKRKHHRRHAAKRGCRKRSHSHRRCGGSRTERDAGRGGGGAR
jgi:hypothetical protein